MSATASAAAPAPQPAYMQGAALGITAVALALGTFMQVLDTTIANVSIPTISGNLGTSTEQGTWIITSFAVSNGDQRAAHGLADAAVRCRAHVHRIDSRVHGGVAAVWIRVEPRQHRHVPHPAGRGLRPDHPRFPGAADDALPAGPQGSGTGDLVDDHAGRTDLRAVVRRLDLRQRELAVDFLHQHPGRPVRRVHLLDVSRQARDPHSQTVDRQSGPRVAGSLGGLVADHARQGQGR